MTKQIISIRIDEDELRFYKNLVEDKETSMSELITRALRQAYRPPLKHQWRCGICGKPQKPDSIDDCSGTFEDLEDED